MNVEQVNQILFAEMMAAGWYYGTSREPRFDQPLPHHVNNGMCEEWAMKAQELFGGEVVWLDTFASCKDWAHCVLRLNGKYYDSLHPNGASSLKEFRRIAKVYFQLI